jgi:dipeptidyl aminopeptidase/acylaminoacyl peptidase
MTKLIAIVCCCFVLVASGPVRARASAPERHPMTLDDVFALKDVEDPQISPDGAWVAYTVTSTDAKRDKQDTDIWMVSWDGTRTVRLTSSKASESTPRWSPDGRYLAFLSGRDDDGEHAQLWVLNRLGGDAERITEVKGDVEDFDWSPDGSRAVLQVHDPDPNDAADAKDSKQPAAETTLAGEESAKKKTLKPIVLDRFQFKQDETGYLDARRSHLFVVDIATKKLDQLTSGATDEILPSWSPDGSTIAFVTKRGADPDRTDNYDIYAIEPRVGAVARQITTFEGGDCDPYWESRPAWSPDSKFIAYPQGGPPKLIGYNMHDLAVIPAAGGAGRIVTKGLDRNCQAPRWTADGSTIVFLLEDDRATQLARVSAGGGKVERIVTGERDVTRFDLGNGDRLAALVASPTQPAEIYAIEGTATRALSTQNRALMDTLAIAPTESTSFKSKDGTEVHGFLTKPADFQAGKPYPAILRIHGGPVWQFYYGFRPDWQLLAAQGFVVIACNPRGSSGRGLEYAKAIYADWGNKDAKDVLAAVDDAVSRGIADPARLGIGGWSYGGMLTNYVIAQDPRFKAAVSGASTSNILAGYGTDQYVRDYEHELGTPWANTDVYLKLSFPFLRADKIVTPTLFLCGEKDFNVPLLNSEQMYQALRSLGRDTQLVIYPGEFHEIRTPSYLRDRLERYVSWYRKYLQAR